MYAFSKSFAKKIKEPLPPGQCIPLAGSLLDSFAYGLGKLESMLPWTGPDSDLIPNV